MTHSQNIHLRAWNIEETGVEAEFFLGDSNMFYLMIIKITFEAIL